VPRGHLLVPVSSGRKQRQPAGRALLIARKGGPKADLVAAQDRLMLELKGEVERLRGRLARPI
jgi:antitoxin (DNA-binding transcriptional repressor) of toxin-antitoxin stability system